MQQILILGGGAAGLAAALAAAQTAEGRAHITVLDKNAKVGKKLLATGNGRCNLDNRDITPERYFTSSPKALRRLLSAVDEAAPLAWFESLGLYPRTDEAGRVYPYSNQAADVLALLEHHLSRLGVEVRTLHRPEPEPEPGRLCRPNRNRGRPRDPAGRRRHLRHGR